jgi:hypothetical protein
LPSSLPPPDQTRLVPLARNAVRAAAQGGAKTDRIDVALHARLLASGFLAEVWAPDEPTRARAVKRYPR